MATREDIESKGCFYDENLITESENKRQKIREGMGAILGGKLKEGNSEDYVLSLLIPWLVQMGVAIKVDRELPNCPECGGMGWRPVTQEEQRHLVTASKTVCLTCQAFAGYVATIPLVNE